MNTSACVNVCFYAAICGISSEFKLSISKIFTDLIEIVSNEISAVAVSGLLTEYQDRGNEQWVTVHYYLNGEEADKYSYLRFKYRISISKLAFFGFVLFWDKLVEKYKKKHTQDNKRINLSNYEKFLCKMAHMIPVYKKRLGIIGNDPKSEKIT